MSETKNTLAIGIDPGAVTGVAVYDTEARGLLIVDSMQIHQAMALISKAHADGDLKVVIFEDARMRSWFGKAGRERLQGAGSIKRDCQIMADFLADLGCPFKNVKPAAGATKWTAEKFRKITGWTGRTNEHGRDAGVLVWGAR